MAEAMIYKWHICYDAVEIEIKEVLGEERAFEDFEFRLSALALILSFAHRNNTFCDLLHLTLRV